MEPSADMPHGIKYALTLHNRYGKRLLGFDNAHAIKPPKKFKHAGKKYPFDHVHQHVSDKGRHYEFDTPDKLLSDFFAAVDQAIKELGP